MSNILFKFRLCSPAKIQALDNQIEIEMLAQAERFSDQLDLPTCHQAHSYILSNYTHHLVLLLHRICLFKPENIEDESPRGSYGKCEHAALTILSNYETLNSRNEFGTYRWYIYGLGSFHAFLAISTLLVLLGKPQAPRNPKDLILQAVQSCFERLHEQRSVQ